MQPETTDTEVATDKNVADRSDRSSTAPNQTPDNATGQPTTPDRDPGSIEARLGEIEKQARLVRENVSDSDARLSLTAIRESVSDVRETLDVTEDE